MSPGRWGGAMSEVAYGETGRRTANLKGIVAPVEMVSIAWR